MPAAARRPRLWLERDNTPDPLALVYNDASVWENHHAATTFRVLNAASNNILSALQPRLDARKYGAALARLEQARRHDLDRVLLAQRGHAHVRESLRGLDWGYNSWLYGHVS